MSMTSFYRILLWVVWFVMYGMIQSLAVWATLTPIVWMIDRRLKRRGVREEQAIEAHRVASAAGVVYAQPSSSLYEEHMPGAPISGPNKWGVSTNVRLEDWEYPLL
tara:strand:+ start:261 stop:578 length:318 start_codon:yes stop_codon:yes gene_type:complete